MSSDDPLYEAEGSELADELAAINSIYGDRTLERSRDDPTSYVLALPGEASSLRLQFPASYPAEPPSILGTYSSGESARRGAAARDLGLFREAVGLVYEPGQVCIFDAIEELARLRESLSAEDAADAAADPGGEGGTDPVPPSPTRDSLPLTTDGPEPPWILSDPVTELKSTFIARCAAVSSPGQASQFVQHLLDSDRRVRSATHNITAWRIRGPNQTAFQDCNDDGETAAGGRLLHLMQLMDIWDSMVIVTRWYGGQKLGPRRFAVINQVARDAFAKAGLVADNPAKKKSHGR